MIANILIAGAFFALGNVTGIWASGWALLSKYKKYPVDVILLIDHYAQKW